MRRRRLADSHARNAITAAANVTEIVFGHAMFTANASRAAPFLIHGMAESYRTPRDG